MKRICNLVISISAFTFLLLFPLISEAQEKLQDVIYLNNGSILRGEITEIKANESITMISNCGDKWVFKQEDIKRVAKEASKGIVDNKKPKEEISYLSNHFYSNINIGVMLNGKVESIFPSMSLMFLNGYQFKWGLAVGAGLGIDVIDETYMPIVGDIRYTFKDTRFSHFVFFQGGYALPLGDPDTYEYDYYNSDFESKGGYILNPGIGFRININDKNAFTFSVGYKYIELDQEYKDFGGQIIERTTKYNRVTLGVGFYF